jgi:hypothetical protein
MSQKGVQYETKLVKYRLVLIREFAPRLGYDAEDLAVGYVRVRRLDCLADLVLVEEVRRGRAFGRVGVLGFLFPHLALALFALAVERAVAGSSGILVLVGLFGAAGLAPYGWAIGGGEREGCRCEGDWEGAARVGLGDGEDVLEVVCECVRLVRTLAESLRGVADAGDELGRAETARRDGRGVSALFGATRAATRAGEGRTAWR